MRERGVTIVGVVSVSALALMTCAAVVFVMKPSSISAGRQGCAGNLRSIYQAAALYSADNGGGEETPELQGFSYVYDSSWRDVLSDYGPVYDCDHCTSEPANLKAFGTTYGFHLKQNKMEDNAPPSDSVRISGRRSTDKVMTTLSRKLGLAMPIASCQVHDELEAFYNDPVAGRRLMDPFMNWIGADGKIRFERAPWMLRYPMSEHHFVAVQAQ